MSTSADSPEKELRKDLEDYQEHVGKIDLAHRANVMMDLSQVLQAERRNNQRVEDFLMTGQAPEIKPVDNDMGNVYIDSPTTHNHNYSKPESKGGLMPWLLAAAVAGGAGGGLGWGLSLFNKTPPQKLEAVPVQTQQPAQAPATINNRSGFLIELVPQQPKKEDK